ncbi:MAG: type II toxin-antitoxin system HicA family toxin [Bryobacteraceae bacterium]
MQAAGCQLKRHGTRHDHFHNPKTGRNAAIPRHTEIKNTLAAVIKNQLGI